MSDPINLREIAERRAASASHPQIKLTYTERDALVTAARALKRLCALDGQCDLEGRPVDPDAEFSAWEAAHTASASFVAEEPDA